MGEEGSVNGNLSTRRCLAELVGAKVPTVVGIVGRHYEHGVEVGPGVVVESSSNIIVGDFLTLADPAGLCSTSVSR